MSHLEIQFRRKENLMGTGHFAHGEKGVSMREDGVTADLLRHCNSTFTDLGVGNFQISVGDMLSFLIRMEPDKLQQLKVELVLIIKMIEDSPVRKQPEGDRAMHAAISNKISGWKMALAVYEKGQS